MKKLNNNWVNMTCMSFNQSQNRKSNLNSKLFDNLQKITVTNIILRIKCGITLRLAIISL